MENLDCCHRRSANESLRVGDTTAGSAWKGENVLFYASSFALFTLWPYHHRQ